MKIYIYIGCIGLFSACFAISGRKAPVLQKDQVLSRLNAINQKLIQDVKILPLDSTAIPRALASDGSLEATTSYAWTSGFFPGTLWKMARHSDDPVLHEYAQAWTQFQEKEKVDTHTHDLGFKIYCSFGEGNKFKTNPEYQKIIQEASRTLIRRFNETVGAIRSWDFKRDVWQFPVIIDNMMNLEMLFEATKMTGDSIFHHIAYQHALTTDNNHFRTNSSSYHVIDYDTTDGSVRNRHTHQGISHESSWARGQAWGIYGFTMSYRYTKDPRFLVRAQRIADYIFSHTNLPEDKIPYWDYNAPNIPNETRDVSAATVTASALLELMEYDEDRREQYLTWADQILESLEDDNYQTTATAFILDKSTGNRPDGSEINVPIVYADYYYVEALMRRLNWF